jgi:alpha-beta hydrolase superfamily lysophospholipase
MPPVTLPRYTPRLVRIACKGLLLAGALWLAVAAGFAAQAWWRLPKLSPWHEMVLDHEFHARHNDAPKTFAEYLALEQRLFAELKQRIYDNVANADTWDVGRYTPGSPVAQLALDAPGNRSSDERVPGSRGAVLLLHGLSDAPYSLHAVGREFRDRGFDVVSLRLPGHGTVPAALTDVDWEDWEAAATLAARHAAELAGAGQPFYIAGYSTGAPLALMYALRALDDASLPMPKRLFLFSPAIGVSDFAVMTNAAAGLAFIPGLEKARWLDVLPEYDPYKYNSFPVNAANQVWSLTRALERALVDAQKRGTLDRMPTITAFQSLVDATVLAADVGKRLFARLPARGHELVVFDVNRNRLLAGLIAPWPKRAFDAMLDTPALPFRLTVVGNRSANGEEVAEWIREPGSREALPTPLGLKWPRDVLSLGHLAIPLPVDDPLYGILPAPRPGGPEYTLGGPAPRAESGALAVPLGSLARIHSNPFFPVIVRRIDQAAREDGLTQ